jgi:hypothetical protein
MGIALSPGQFPILSGRSFRFTSYRELTRAELREIRKLAANECANYDREYGCLVLDGKCYMFYGAAYTNSALCKYFRNAVLPLRPELEALFSGEHHNPVMRKCAVCGAGFVPSGRGCFCSGKCRAESKRVQDRDSKRRQRRDKGVDVRK